MVRPHLSLIGRQSQAKALSPTPTGGRQPQRVLESERPPGPYDRAQWKGLSTQFVGETLREHLQSGPRGELNWLPPPGTQRGAAPAAEAFAEYNSDFIIRVSEGGARGLYALRLIKAGTPITSYSGRVVPDCGGMKRAGNPTDWLIRLPGSQWGIDGAQVAAFAGYLAAKGEHEAIAGLTKIVGYGLGALSNSCSHVTALRYGGAGKHTCDTLWYSKPVPMAVLTASVDIQAGEELLWKYVQNSERDAAGGEGGGGR